jgi:hypothetical protein
MACVWHINGWYGNNLSREVRDIDEPFWNSMVGLRLGKSF